MLQMKDIKKLSMLINTILMGLFLFAVGFFRSNGITYMMYHCIPTVIVYVPLYYLIYKEKLHLYVILLYTNLTVYMAAATICLGYYSGFQLYCMSLIPLAFYMEYIAHQLHTKRLNAWLISMVLAGAFLACTVYVILNGPVYEIDIRAACACQVVNAVSVFFFLIGYANLTLKTAMDSEKKLSDMANTDRLTGLFNRHYTMRLLEEIFATVHPGQWVAMADIDDFKKINDTYGHGGGDYVLVELAKIMGDVCRECTVSRWGGEEFLIISGSAAADSGMIEWLRQKVESTDFSYQGQPIPVTITAGVSYYQDGQSMSSWIQSADNKLYEGKHTNKNRVIC